jgi:hypothetical protein
MKKQFVAVAVVAFLCSAALADDLPDGFRSFKSTTASAGIWANTRKTDESIARKSVAMVNEALAASPNAMALLVAPNKYLPASSDKAYCEKLSADFVAKPMAFGPKAFKSVEDFSDWFADLSQGKGDEGKALYARCDKACSPSYAVVLNKGAAGYSANVRAACNQPRDKDDNLYLLQSGVAK